MGFIGTIKKYATGNFFIEEPIPWKYEQTKEKSQGPTVEVYGEVTILNDKIKYLNWERVKRA